MDHHLALVDVLEEEVQRLVDFLDLIRLLLPLLVHYDVQVLRFLAQLILDKGVDFLEQLEEAIELEDELVVVLEILALALLLLQVPDVVPEVELVSLVLEQQLLLVHDVLVHSLELVLESYLVGI